MIPIHRNDLEQRMNVVPDLNRQQNIIAVFTPIENLHVVEIEIHNVNLGVILPEIIPKLVHIAAPIPVHQHQIFPVQILNRQSVFLCQLVVDGHPAAQALTGNLKSGTAKTGNKRCHISGQSLFLWLDRGKPPRFFMLPTISFSGCYGGQLGSQLLK